MTRVRMLPVWLLALVLLLGAQSCRSREGDSASAAAAERARDASRIVALGNAVTEIAFALGHGDQVVGVDASSAYPSEVEALPHLGYYRMVGAEAVLALEPTLVLALEGTPAQTLEQLEKAGVEVAVIPQGDSLDTARARIRAVARVLGEEEDGEALVSRLDADLEETRGWVERCLEGRERPRVLFVYVRGGRAQLVMGRGTGADTMVELAGGRNAVSLEGSRPITAEAVVEAAPEVLVVPTASLEGLGGEQGLARLPGVAQAMATRPVSVVSLDDTELLGFGPRAGAAAGQLARALHPECAP